MTASSSVIGHRKLKSFMIDDEEGDIYFTLLIGRIGGHCEIGLEITET
jgi:hypothetical protein